MPFVPVPKDLTKVKTKVALNLTKRQIVCFSLGALVGVPTYIFTRGAIGNESAVLLMIGLMLPFFFFAMYEKDGIPLEKVLKNFINAIFLHPQTRPYQTNNIYAALERQEKLDKEVEKSKNPPRRVGGHTGGLIPPVRSAVSEANPVISAEMTQTKKEVAKLENKAANQAGKKPASRKTAAQTSDF